MAISASTNWYVRAGGNELNGGGYDSTISGAVTNYADQDAAQLSLTDIVTNGTSTVTSATAGFTSAMIGNCLRIVGDGYYFITARASSTSITVDRSTSTSGSGKSGRVGGAHASVLNYSNGGTAPSPLLTTPLAAGHKINMQGSGSSDPSPSSPDYDFTAGYWTFPSGDTTSGFITLLGYNGRPQMKSHGLTFYNNAGWIFANLKFVLSAIVTFTTYGPIGGDLANGDILVACNDIIFDSNGRDSTLASNCSLIGCELRNSGTQTTGGSNAGVRLSIGSYPIRVIGCTIRGLNGSAILAADNAMLEVADSIIASNGNIGIDLSGLTGYTCTIQGNTIDGNTNHGVYINQAGALRDTIIQNNILSNNGGYGLTLSGLTTAIVDRCVKYLWDYNNFYSNTSGARNNVSAGAHDLALNPQYTNASAGDYSIGTNLKAAGFPGVFPSGLTTGYLDMGAVQRQEAGGGGAILSRVFTGY